jgi:Flp pilus assembly protein CpaB
MSSNGTQKNVNKTLQRPKASTVFAAAFLAGAAAAVGVNRALDVHIAQNVPQVESEPIFVALRTLPEGSPITIYDVALRDWPVAMLPATALRSNATFDGFVLRHPLHEGQPILSLQLAKSSLESSQQIAAVTRRVSSTSRPQKTSAPAFIPYNATPPIPATMAPAVDKTPEYNNVDFALQTPESNASSTDQEPIVQEKILTHGSPSVAFDSESEQPENNEENGSDSIGQKVAVELQNEAVVSDSIDPSEEILKKPTEQHADSTSQPEEKMTAAITEDKVETPEVVSESGSVEITLKNLATVEIDQPDHRALTEPLMADEGGEATEKVVIQQPALAASSEPPTLTEKNLSPEQVLVTTNNTIASQPPTDAAKTSTVKEASSASKTAVAKTPTLAQTPVEPVDITQSIVAEAESRRTALNASPVTPSQPKIASTETSLTSSRLRPAQVTTKQQTMRYLVVPERIAVQVDHAFTSPQVTAPPVRPTKDNVPRQKSNVRPLPKTTAASIRSSQQNNNQNRQTSKTVATQPQQLQATAGNPPRSQRTTQAGGQVAARASNKEETKEPLKRSFFPKISAGLSAVGQEWQKFRNGSSTSSEEDSSNRQATQNSPRQQRSASRPQQSR